jgi:capsular polysaccharide transport system permease protein
MSLLAFLVTGWLAYFAFIRTFKSFKGSGAASRVLLFPQVTTLDTIISNLLVEWYIYTIVFLLFVGAALLIERSPMPANGLMVLLAFWSVSIFGSLLGLIISSLARVFPVLDNLTMIYRRLAVMISGIAVSAADTPPRILAYMSWSPLFHCIEIMREAWWPAYVSPIADAGYVIKALFFMAVFGLAIERFTRRYVE